MANRIKTNDMVKIISGDHKGEIARVIKMLPGKSQALLDGIGQRTRHIAKSMTNPMGGKRDIQVPIHLSKLALVIDEKSKKTSRIGYKVAEKGIKNRVARQGNDKVIADSVSSKSAVKKGDK